MTENIENSGLIIPFWNTWEIVIQNGREGKTGRAGGLKV
jgi:hypothetical protein